MQIPGVDLNVQLSEAYRRVEQLVVYVRALHMLSSALQLAQQEVAAKKLHLSPAVKQGKTKIIVLIFAIFFFCFCLLQQWRKFEKKFFCNFLLCCFIFKQYSKL